MRYVVPIDLHNHPNLAKIMEMSVDIQIVGRVSTQQPEHQGGSSNTSNIVVASKYDAKLYSAIISQNCIVLFPVRVLLDGSVKWPHGYCTTTSLELVATLSQNTYSHIMRDVNCAALCSVDDFDAVDVLAGLKYGPLSTSRGTEAILPILPISNGYKRTDQPKTVALTLIATRNCELSPLLLVNMSFSSLSVDTSLIRINAQLNPSSSGASPTCRVSDVRASMSGCIFTPASSAIAQTPSSPSAIAEIDGDNNVLVSLPR